MKNSFQRIVPLVVVMIILLMSASGESRKYPGVQAEVTSEFSIARRTFRRGTYQFLLVGPGLLAIRNPHGPVLAVFMTRPLKSFSSSSPGSLIFRKHKKQMQLKELWPLGQEQRLEIVAEEPALPPNQYQPSPIPWELFQPSDFTGRLKAKQ